MRSPPLVAALLVPLAAALGCFVDTPIASTSMGSTAATTSTGASSTAATGAETGASSPGTGTGTGTSASASTSAAGSSSSGGPAAVCGDGIQDPGEGCDDGNLSDLDACLSTCEPASCEDGVRSQDESDVDCGGVCPPCQLCGACTGDDECAAGSCGPAGRCVFTVEVTIDYLANCMEPGDPDAWVEVEVPAGTYLASALESAASVWSPPYTPPDRGWGWRAPCVGLTFEAMRTPPGIYYATEAEAFAALLAPSEAFEFAGGVLKCGLEDSACSDNQGAVTFRARSLCE